MQEVIKLMVGVFVLMLGIPIGSFLAKITREELKKNQRVFRAIIIISIIGAIVSLIIWNDILLFTFLFIAVVTSRSLRNKR
jgi:uncharacterized membrane protein YeaQ/YmgE (transglycosylase-associated protein family)